MSVYLREYPPPGEGGKPRGEKGGKVEGPPPTSSAFYLWALSCALVDERPAIPALRLSAELAEAASSAGRSSFHSLVLFFFRPN